MASQVASGQTRPSVAVQLRRLRSVAGHRLRLLYIVAAMGLLVSVVGVASADLAAKLTGFMLDKNAKAFLNLVVPAILLRLGETVLTGAQHYVSGRFGQEVIERLRFGVASRLSQATAAAASKDHSGQTLSRMTNDLAATQNLLQSSLPMIVTDTVRAALALGYMLWKHWILALVAVFGAPAVFAIVGRLNGPVMTLSKQGQEKLAEANQTVSESLAGAEMVRSFGLQEQMYAAFTGHTDAWMRMMRKYSSLTAFAGAAGFGASFTPFILVFGIGGFLVLKGQIRLGMLLAFMDLLNYVTFPTQQMPGLLTQMAAEASSVERVLDLLDTAVERQDGSDFLPDPAFPAIEFRNVTFTYPGASVPSLKEVSFQVPAGAMVGVAGPSGSGKSTVFRLLLGDYAPDSGEIRVFGHSLHEWSLAFLRTRLMSVSQDTYLFPFSVRDNLALGKAGIDADRIQEAARVAQADAFVQSLPQGYESLVGELGNRISAGERQRLSLARSLVQPADVLLLDEATSALDNQSERKAMDAIRDTKAGTTVLVIAHRLSSIQHADTALVFDGGLLAEQGSHEDLMAKKGKYYQLYNAQETRGERA